MNQSMYQKYQSILEQIASDELKSTIIITAIISVMIIVMCLCLCLYFFKCKKKSIKKYNSPKYKKRRRQSIIAAVLLSVACILLSVFLISDYAQFKSDIDKDINQKEYITYTGEFFILKHNGIFNRWYSVNLNDKFTSYYISDIYDYINTSFEIGEHNGTVVYAKNSGIVVDMSY